ncbi:unnamed protein product [Heligmosomoides polygyrus]|uniref:Protein polybromo-1-like n=1 Tax=Heligmosomoides polygyrus TaxID=6339 RepID=A0A183FI72_HELPZ|nr:unnamed protein product [Heligmosomoides polygyrus]
MSHVTRATGKEVPGSKSAAKGAKRTRATEQDTASPRSIVKKGRRQETVSTDSAPDDNVSQDDISSTPRDENQETTVHEDDQQLVILKEKVRRGNPSVIHLVQQTTQEPSTDQGTSGVCTRANAGASGNQGETPKASKSPKKKQSAKKKGRPPAREPTPDPNEDDETGSQDPAPPGGDPDNQGSSGQEATPPPDFRLGYADHAIFYRTYIQDVECVRQLYVRNYKLAALVDLADKDLPMNVAYVCYTKYVAETKNPPSPAMLQCLTIGEMLAPVCR